MTEQLIRDVAARHGLTVEKRVTTGTDEAGFATFELSRAYPAQMHAAFDDLKADGPPFPTWARVTNPDHPDRGLLFIEVQSVWFDDTIPRKQG